VIDLGRLDRPPAGFAACRVCAYRDTGSAPICFSCASEHTEPLAARSCDVCGQALPGDGRCANPVCHFDDRYFARVWAVSMRTGQMRTAISRYKYDEKWGWAAIFGRILIGFLSEHRSTFASYDLITPSPSYVGPGAARSFDHTRRIVEAAEIEEPIEWPFAYELVTKTGPTEPMVGRSWRERKAIAEGPLRAALVIPHPGEVIGKRVLVIDDVFTEGFTLREVARALRLAGASEVSEVVLAREPWKGGLGSRRFGALVLGIRARRQPGASRAVTVTGLAGQGAQPRGSGAHMRPQGAVTSDVFSDADVSDGKDGAEVAADVAAERETPRSRDKGAPASAHGSWIREIAPLAHVGVPAAVSCVPTACRRRLETPARERM
jgi:predicted amidophosphoribosyltransferase